MTVPTHAATIISACPGGMREADHSVRPGEPGF
jgi:hypothetical protein